MREIEISKLVPGLIFSDPVFIMDNYILVPAYVPIRQKDLDRLVAWGIDTVKTKGKAITQDDIPEKEPPPEPPNTKKLPKGNQKNAPITRVNKKASKFAISEVQENAGPYRSYNSLIDKLDAIFTCVVTGADLETRTIDNICSQLLQELRDNRNSFIGFILGGEVSGYELAKSSINTAILSALTAQELKLPQHKILQIVTGALLHDIGMLKLPKSIVDKRGQLSDTELQQIKSHPLHTSKIVTKELSYPKEINLIALQHHERWDGQGYPEQLQGTQIDMGARIVTVADAFEAMVSQKSYRNSMAGYQAMKNLLADNSRRFDPEVLKAFAKIMGIYPIGSIVLLNNGAYARVIEVHSSAPLRPTVRILIDDKGKAFNLEDGEVLDLLNIKNVFIKKPVDPVEFAQVND